MTLIQKIAEKKKKKDMPSFTKQDRPESVKKIYRALKKPKSARKMRERYGKDWKAVAARIAARQGQRGKQEQGPPYKGPIEKAAELLWISKFAAVSLPQKITPGKRVPFPWEKKTPRMPKPAPPPGARQVRQKRALRTQAPGSVRPDAMAPTAPPSTPAPPKDPWASWDPKAHKPSTGGTPLSEAPATGTNPNRQARDWEFGRRTVARVRRFARQNPGTTAALTLGGLGTLGVGAALARRGSDEQQ